MLGSSKILTVLAIPLVLAGCVGPSEGEEAYRAGRFPEAHAAFVRASEGEDPSPEVLVNRTLAALGAGDLPDAASSAERVAGGDGPELARVGDFLLGNVAYARCEIAEKQAATPEAEPFAYDIAIEYGKTARDSWKRAVASREDWPEARRNVERALLRLRSLETQKAEKEQARKPIPKPMPRIILRPPEDDDPDPEAQLTELRPEQVLALLEKLGEKEKEKRELRRSHRGERMAKVEKDW